MTIDGAATEDERKEVLVASKYELIKPIGKGKFAVVWRSRRISDGETVALKKMAVEGMEDKTREKCLKEVQLLQSLDHPNIVRCFDSMLDGNELVIIFEWAAAGDLKRQIRKTIEGSKCFDQKLIWKYFAQISEAITHIHSRRIVHRDLKPANILLTLQGVVKVADLGLGRMLSEFTVQAHSKVGTPLYMSPEIVKGEKGYDYKCDIWSLGCILYELAVLRSPFKVQGLNLYTLFQNISNADYKPLPDHLSDTLRTLAHRMLTVDPLQRPEAYEVRDIAVSMYQQELQHDFNESTSSEHRHRTAENRTLTQEKCTSDQQNRPRETESKDIQEPSESFLSKKQPPPPEIHGTTKARTRRKSTQKSSIEHTLLTASECIYDKLIILGYQRKRFASGEAPLLRWHFALDGEKLGLPRYTQFTDAAHSIQFVFHTLGLDFELYADEAPSQLATRMVTILIDKVNFPADRAAAVSTHEMARGFGPGLCDVLNWITEKAVRQIRLKPVLYDEALEDELLCAPIELSCSDIKDDSGCELQSPDASTTAVLFAEEHTCTDQDARSRAPIITQVDADEWMLECERVAPRLRISTRDTTDWRQRLQTCHNGIAQLLRDDARSKSIAAKRFSAVITSEAKSIAKGEALLARTFQGKSLVYAESKDTATRLAAETESLQSCVSDLTHELARVEDVIANLCFEIQQHDHSQDGPAGLKRIRTALSTLRRDTKSLDVATGVARHRALHFQRRHSREEQDDPIQLFESDDESIR